MDAFLASVEKRAFRMAEIATGNRDEALDILQDAMFKLVEKYADRDTKEWGPLFTTILQSRIKDWYRRNQVRNRFRSWFSHKDDEQEDPIQQAKDEKARTPEQLLQSDRRIDELDLAMHALPLRQQQAFLLRIWEGYSVEETAKAMKCSAGSVKTHYSRAVHTLRDKLGDHWE
ncbi:MAG TPA: RNA polymerase sigma factor [Thiotrichaceae bacterium]|jgi:RNA polymerase sigma-70 factor (ECF subfamily)|nr:RNA polymerase sigma factor [Thiotrichaceae bacterium]HIM07438.1 RNA polymerase sigma factor [Gammaproteobacteria bacterium]